MSETQQNIPFDEQETHAYVEYIENLGHVYSNHKPTIKTLRRYAEDYPDQVHVEIDDAYGYQVSLPMEWIRVQPPRKYSKEAKEKAAANLLAVRQSRKRIEDA